MSPRARLPRGEGALLREEILNAADRLLVETASEEAVSIRAIADTVGVTPPSIYRHFADKDDLMFAVCERTFGRLNEVFEKVVVGLDDPIEAIETMGRAYVAFGLDHPEHYRLLFMSHHHGKDSEVLADGRLTSEAVEGSRAFNFLLALVERVLAQAPPDSPRPDAVTLTAEVWAAVHGQTALRISFPGMPWPPIETSVASVADGLRARFAP